MRGLNSEVLSKPGGQVTWGGSGWEGEKREEGRLKVRNQQAEDGTFWKEAVVIKEFEDRRFKPESGDTEVENKGEAWVEFDSWRRDAVLWRAAMPCCSKEPSLFLAVSLLCLFPFFSPSARVRLSKDAERQTADRAVTITPFRSIQTFWGGECRGERKKGGS